jgi:hypothetical protein
MMESAQVLCLLGRSVVYDFSLAAGSFRQAEEPGSKVLLQQIEDEEARFHIWAASLGILKIDSAFPAEYFDVNKDASEQTERLLFELTECLDECMDVPYPDFTTDKDIRRGPERYGHWRRRSGIRHTGT